MDKYNCEGYLDPTAYEALISIAKFDKPYLPLIYVASPFADDMERNMTKARSYSLFVVGKGSIPIAPHLLFPQFMDENDKEERELALRFALTLLGKCDELWVFGGKITNGMSREIAKAKCMRKPIRYFDHKLREVKSYGD